MKFAKSCMLIIFLTNFANVAFAADQQCLEDPQLNSEEILNSKQNVTPEVKSFLSFITSAARAIARNVAAAKITQKTMREVQEHCVQTIVETILISPGKFAEFYQTACVGPCNIDSDFYKILVRIAFKECSENKLYADVYEAFKQDQKGEIVSEFGKSVEAKALALFNEPLVITEKLKPFSLEVPKYLEKHFNFIKNGMQKNKKIFIEEFAAIACLLFDLHSSEEKKAFSDQTRHEEICGHYMEFAKVFFDLEPKAELDKAYCQKMLKIFGPVLHQAFVSGDFDNYWLSGHDHNAVRTKTEQNYLAKKRTLQVMENWKKLLGDMNQQRADLTNDESVVIQKVYLDFQNESKTLSQESSQKVFESKVDETLKRFALSASMLESEYLEDFEKLLKWKITSLRDASIKQIDREQNNERKILKKEEGQSAQVILQEEKKRLEEYKDELRQISSPLIKEHESGNQKRLQRYIQVLSELAASAQFEEKRLLWAEKNKKSKILQEKTEKTTQAIILTIFKNFIIEQKAEKERKRKKEEAEKRAKKPAIIITRNSKEGLHFVSKSSVQAVQPVIIAAPASISELPIEESPKPTKKSNQKKRSSRSSVPSQVQVVENVTLVPEVPSPNLVRRNSGELIVPTEESANLVQRIQPMPGRSHNPYGAPVFAADDAQELLKESELTPRHFGSSDFNAEKISVGWSYDDNGNSYFSDERGRTFWWNPQTGMLE